MGAMTFWKIRHYFRQFRHYFGKFEFSKKSKTPEDVKNYILQVHEVLIENTDKGSVITWDFDVMKHDVMFCVFRTVEAVKRKGGSTSAVTKEKKEELGSFNNMGTSGDPEHYTG